MENDRILPQDANNEKADETMAAEVMVSEDETAALERRRRMFRELAQMGTGVSQGGQSTGGVITCW